MPYFCAILQNKSFLYLIIITITHTCVNLIALKGHIFAELLHRLYKTVPSLIPSKTWHTSQEHIESLLLPLTLVISVVLWPRCSLSAPLDLPVSQSVRPLMSNFCSWSRSVFTRTERKIVRVVTIIVIIGMCSCWSHLVGEQARPSP